ncbi:MAG: metallophosphatase [Bergeyella zoohelcum]|nr:metallophosphatase [Bergeyella zoohelcum]
MNRKEFLKIAGAGSLAMSLAPNLLFSQSNDFSAKNSVHKLTILHTNDQHSRIEPFDSESGRNANQGGFARRATLINQIRKEEKNVLLLDSGDVFQGTPYFNMFGGELEFKLMSMMGYEASTMGNHEFDNGLEGFVKALPNAKFPFITSNYDFSNTIVEGRTEKYKILNKNGIKVGIFGLGVELDGLVGKKQYKETKYLNPIEIAQDYTKLLKVEKKCDLVICLSHLGYKYKENDIVSDIHLAQKTENIDLILGGHTHTFLPEPQRFTNKAGKVVLVNQVGFAGLLLGRLDFYFDKHKKIQNISWNNQVIDNKLDTILV